MLETCWKNLHSRAGEKKSLTSIFLIYCLTSIYSFSVFSRHLIYYSGRCVAHLFRCDIWLETSRKHFGLFILFVCVDMHSAIPACCNVCFTLKASSCLAALAIFLQSFVNSVKLVTYNGSFELSGQSATPVLLEIDQTLTCIRSYFCPACSDNICLRR